MTKNWKLGTSEREKVTNNVFIELCVRNVYQNISYSMRKTLMMFTN